MIRFLERRNLVHADQRHMATIRTGNGSAFGPGFIAPITNRKFEGDQDRVLLRKPFFIELNMEFPSASMVAVGATGMSPRSLEIAN